MKTAGIVRLITVAHLVAVGGVLGVSALAIADPPDPPFPTIGASGDEPLCWMQETPPGWTGCTNDPDENSPWTFDPHFVPMLTLNKNSIGFDPDPGPVYDVLKIQYNRYYDIIDDASYGFYAPRESCRPYDPTFAGSFRSMRRTFEFGLMDLTQFVKTESDEYIINLKLVQTGDEPFITKYDLVQCLYINGSSIGASPTCNALPLTEEEEEEEESMLAWGPGDPQGGDMNYDGWHGPDDTSTFGLAYFADHPSADVNNDSLIDSADVAQYFGWSEE